MITAVYFHMHKTPNFRQSPLTPLREREPFRPLTTETTLHLVNLCHNRCDRSRRVPQSRHLTLLIFHEHNTYSPYFLYECCITLTRCGTLPQPQAGVGTSFQGSYLKHTSVCESPSVNRFLFSATPRDRTWDSRMGPNEILRLHGTPQSSSLHRLPPCLLHPWVRLSSGSSLFGYTEHSHSGNTSDSECGRRNQQQPERHTEMEPDEGTRQPTQENPRPQESGEPQTRRAENRGEGKRRAETPKRGDEEERNT
jgi:hypothetical protein